MGQNQDCRHVYLTGYAKAQRRENGQRATVALVTAAIIIMVLGFGALTVRSGIEEASRIAAETQLH